jgi:hypothetical protein
MFILPPRWAFKEYNFNFSRANVKTRPNPCLSDNSKFAVFNGQISAGGGTPAPHRVCTFSNGLLPLPKSPGAWYKSNGTGEGRGSVEFSYLPVSL